MVTLWFWTRIFENKLDFWELGRFSWIKNVYGTCILNIWHNLLIQEQKYNLKNIYFLIVEK